MDYDDPTLAHPMPSGGGYTISAEETAQRSNYGTASILYHTKYDFEEV